MRRAALLYLLLSRREELVENVREEGDLGDGDHDMIFCPGST